jgi:hypothetical protein
LKKRPSLVDHVPISGKAASAAKCTGTILFLNSV